jgi:hypothetical protein
MLLAVVWTNAWASDANGAAALVVVFAPASSSGQAERSLELDEIATRIRGELLADGFEVRSAIGTLEPGQSPRALAHAHPTAVALVGVSQGLQHSLQLWAYAAQRGSFLNQRIGAETDVSPEVISRRAVEVLRATLLRLLVAPGESPKVAPAPPLAPARRDRVQHARDQVDPQAQRAAFSLEIGGMMTSSPGQIATAIAPGLRLAYHPLENLSTRLSLMSFGTRPNLSDARGRAELDQSLFLSEVILRSNAWRLTPQASLGVGAYRLAVTSSAAPGFRATNESSWSAAIDIGIGAIWTFSSLVGLSAETHMLVAAPFPEVRFQQQVKARIASPMLMGSVGLIGWL